MKNFMNFVGIMLGAVMLCDKATDEKLQKNRLIVF